MLTYRVVTSCIQGIWLVILIGVYFSQVKNKPWLPWVYSWTWHRREQSLSVPMSVSLSVSLSVSMSLYVSMSLSMSVPVSVFVPRKQLVFAMCTAPLLANSIKYTVRICSTFYSLHKIFIYQVSLLAKVLAGSKMESYQNFFLCSAPNLPMNICRLSLFSTPVSFRWTIPLRTYKIWIATWGNFTLPFVVQ